MSSPSPRRSIGRVRLAAAVLLLSCGCRATPEQIAAWKGTQRGPEKLRAVVQDGSADPQLRGLAFAALVEIGMAADAEHDLSAAAPAARAAIVRDAIPPLQAVLGDTLTRVAPTTPAQRAAKDALFAVRGEAADADRAQLDQLLIQWTTADLSARSMLGGASTEKILRAIGPSAAPALLPLVRSGPNLILAAKLLGELGDPAIKKQASAPLLALARGGPSGVRSVPEPILQAIGLVGGADATSFLLGLAGSAGADTRAKALYALAQGKLSAGDDKALSGALAIAADTKAPGEVREAAFGVAEKLGPAAVGGLVKLFTDHDDTVRWRAIEASLKAGGAAAIPRVLPALSQDRPIKSEDLDSYVVHDLAALGKEALPALRTAAARASVPSDTLGAVAAIRALGRLGGAPEVTLLHGFEACDPQQPHCASVSARALLPATTVFDEAHKAKGAIEARIHPGAQRGQ